MRVLLLANFDSSLKYAGRLAEAVASLGAEPDLRIPTTVAPHGLAPAQVRAATSRAVRYEPWPALVAAAADADVVVPVFDGLTVERFIREVHAVAAARMPVIGSGYVGMALTDLEGGFLARSLADVVAVNSRSDLRDFGVTARALGMPDANLLLAGLALLPARPEPTRAAARIRTVLFADQPTVPRRDVDRTYLWDRLAAYAERHPDRTVLLRPRHRPGEDTFHRMEHSPVAWAASRTLPANLRIDHTPIDASIPASDLLLTVSSTAALEAVAAGVRVAFIAEWINDAVLNPRLLPSGLLRRFDDIDADRIGSPDPAWLDDVFPASEGPSPAERFAQRLLAVAAGDVPRVHQALWDSSYHVGRRATDAVLEARIAAASRYTPKRVAAGALRRALRLVES